MDDLETLRRRQRNDPEIYQLAERARRKSAGLSEDGEDVGTKMAGAWRKDRDRS
jgi:hypothetical protein